MLLRVRLSFAPSLDLDGLDAAEYNSWFAVDPALRVIGDLHASIRRAFDISVHRQPELRFSIDGFVVPTGQPISVLRDGDLLRIEPPNQIATQQPPAAAAASLHTSPAAAVQQPRKRERAPEQAPAAAAAPSSAPRSREERRRARQSASARRLHRHHPPPLPPPPRRLRCRHLAVAAAAAWCWMGLLPQG